MNEALIQFIENYFKKNPEIAEKALTALLTYLIAHPEVITQIVTLVLDRFGPRAPAAHAAPA